MRRFSDSTGRWWRLKLDVDALSRIRTLAGVDLLDPADRSTSIFLHHPATFTSVLFAAVEPDAYARDVAEDAFADAMGPEACERVVPLLIAELSDFFPPPRTGAPKQPPKPVDAWQRICRMAGVSGVSPGPHTLRELIDMAEGRDRAGWRQTAAVLALLHNTHFENKKTAEDFYPFSEAPDKGRGLKIPMSMLKPVFVAAEPTAK